MKIDQIIDGILVREGAYSDHPDDHGGPTAFGITEKVARANGFTGDMRELSMSFARDIYKRQYWLEPKFAAVSLLSDSIAEELADTGVNMGPATSARFLQRCLNVLNQQAKLFPDLKVDGQIGPTTLNSLGMFLKHRGRSGEVTLLTALNCLQGARYIEIAETEPNNESFVFGWLRERVMLVP